MSKKEEEQAISTKQYDPDNLLRFESQFDFNLVKGVAFPTFITPEKLEQIKKVKVRDDDVWIVTFPKAGMHWLHEALHMIHNMTTQHSPHDKETFFLEMGKVTELLDEEPSPRFVNTHLLPDFLPDDLLTSKARLIYMYRNPKDTVVSYYHHYMTFVQPGSKNEKMTLGEFVDATVDGYKRYGGYWAHMQQWSKVLCKIPNRTFVLSFEEIKRDQTGVLERLAVFLGRELSSDMAIEMVRALSVERTRDACRSRGLGEKRHELIRKGIAGGWKHHLTVAQSERMDEEAKQSMADVHLPLKLVYDTIF